jgi:hypothetical protein
MSLLDFKSTPKYSDTLRRSIERKVGEKLKLNPFSLQNISDAKLLEMANQYITTDESLDRFQNRLREKFLKSQTDSSQIKIVNPNTNRKINDNKSFNQVLTNTENNNNINIITNSASNNTTVKVTTNKNLPKNISRALEYYNIVESG